MQIGIVGINHKLADLKLRESLAKVFQKKFGGEASIHQGHAFVLLSTCNRTEVYFSSEDLAGTHTYILGILRGETSEEFEHKLYSYFGYDCFTHLIKVASGLDSAIVAETEIQGQVKNAYETASKLCKLRHDLHYLFQKALKVSKEVRSKLIQGRGMPEVEHAILQTGLHMFKNAREKKLLFVGASDINHKVLKFLKNKEIGEITICNRSLEKAEQMAAKYRLNILPFADLKNWHQFDWIIFGTKAPDHLIRKEQSTQFNDKKLIIDLSFPRNVDPKMAKDPLITLLNIDQINRMLSFRKKELEQAIFQAKNVIEEVSYHQIRLFKQKRCSNYSLIAVSA